MNRAFPPETVRNCDNCGQDLVVIVLDDGGFEANDYRDYVDADPGSDPADHRFVCAGCKVVYGIGDPNDY